MVIQWPAWLHILIDCQGKPIINLYYIAKYLIYFPLYLWYDFKNVYKYLCFRTASGAADGEVRLWDLSQRKCLNIYQGHEGKYVRGIVFTPNGRNILSVGDDKHICTWNSGIENETDEIQIVKEPQEIINSKAMLTGITYHRFDEKFATCGDITQLWDAATNYPIKEFQWGVDTVHTIKFNQVEPHVLGACASDRSIIFYDIRLATPMRKVIMELSTNSIGMYVHA